jgi:hypothetical protein
LSEAPNGFGACAGRSVLADLGASVGSIIFGAGIAGPEIVP